MLYALVIVFAIINYILDFFRQYGIIQASKLVSRLCICCKNGWNRGIPEGLLCPGRYCRSPSYRQNLVSLHRFWKRGCQCRRCDWNCSATAALRNKKLPHRPGPFQAYWDHFQIAYLESRNQHSLIEDFVTWLYPPKCPPQDLSSRITSRIPDSLPPVCL